MKVNTYLNFGGNCADAFKFYEQHLGAKILNLMTQGQMLLAARRSRPR